MTDLSTPPQGGRSAGRRGADGPTAPGEARVPAQGGRAAARKAAKKGKKKALKITAWTAAGVLVVATGVGVWAYEKLNGNIKSDALVTGGGDAGKEKPDAFGRTPINILVIGSDSRSGANCKLGGLCGETGERADVEMVVHISADRSNATVMSIPRDLMTELPSCKNEKTGASFAGGRGMINSALGYGPGCSVAAVHKLTGIPIDHFVKVDFQGVVSMSDAVGGVKVCVDANVYDPDSHLKLKQGQHTLKGDAALEFVRTRHGFLDGSDLGRTYTQHLFLSQVINNVKSAGTLTNPAKLWSLADAATKALTVDDSLNSIQKLMGLATDLDKVPTKRITFTTMQNVGDTLPGESGRVLIGPEAQTLFDAISNDQALTNDAGKHVTPAGGGASGSASPKSSASSTPLDLSSIVVDVQNGTTQADGSRVPNRAGTVRDALVSKGFSSKSTSGNGTDATKTTLTYPAAQATGAKAVAKALGLPASALKAGTGSTITLLVGNDWKTGAVFPGGGAEPGTANTKKALANAHAQTADSTGGCAKAQVSRYRTIPTGPRTGITPTQAYARHPEVPDSAP